MKKIMLVLVVIVLGIGMCNVSKPETLTKEQQDNIVKNIAKNYEIKSVKFLFLSRDTVTGIYHLGFTLNDLSTQTGISADNIREFNHTMDVGLSPKEEFEVLERKQPIPLDSVDISVIYIEYLKN